MTGPDEGQIWPTRLSESGLWEAQRSYFLNAGPDAWRTGTVPHYVTNNPVFAESCAEVVLGFLRDLATEAGGAAPPSEPLHIIELGAGAGRFGYLFLRALSRSLERATSIRLPVRYVLTDFAPANLAHLRCHALLRPFVEQGLLDFARFDIEQDDRLTLEQEGSTLGPDTLRVPVVLIANYVFDGVPADAFSVRDGRLHDCLALVRHAPSARASISSQTGFFEGVSIGWQHLPLDAGPYPEPLFNSILQRYARTLDDTTLLFPAHALRCIERIAAWTRGPLLLLVADRGPAHLESLRHLPEPELAAHGSFSLPLNHDAIAQYVRGREGVAFVEPARNRTFHVTVGLLGRGAQECQETALAYHQAFSHGAAEDVRAVRNALRDQLHTLRPTQVLSLIRLSQHDPHALLSCALHLSEHGDRLEEPLRLDLRDAILECWNNYFSIGEPEDVPFQFGLLLYTLGWPADALAMFERSRHIHGDNPTTSWNESLCHFALGNQERAQQALLESLRGDPGLASALSIRTKPLR